MIEMEPNQSICVSLANTKSMTVYHYASFLGRELGRVYTTKFDKEARVILVTRQS